MLAGIAATDAMCGKTLGHYSRSQNHADAAALLGTVGSDGATLVGKFRRLVAAKDDAQYTPTTMSLAAAKSAVRQAMDLVEAARVIFRS